MLAVLELIFKATVKNGSTITIIATPQSLELAGRNFDSRRGSSESPSGVLRLGFSLGFVCQTVQNPASLQIVCYSSSLKHLRSHWSAGHELDSAA